MSDHDDSNSSISRRDFLRLAGAGVTALGIGAIEGSANAASASPDVIYPDKALRKEADICAVL